MNQSNKERLYANAAVEDRMKVELEQIAKDIGYTKETQFTFKEFDTFYQGWCMDLEGNTVAVCMKMKQGHEYRI